MTSRNNGDDAYYKLNVGIIESIGTELYKRISVKERLNKAYYRIGGVKKIHRSRHFVEIEARKYD